MGLKKIGIIACILAGATYVGLHLETQNPHEISPIFQGAYQTPDQIKARPMEANFLTPQARQDLYDTFEKALSVIDGNELEYWIHSGTLLGAVRHEGPVPWDDDIDLCMWEDDAKELLNHRAEFQKVGLDIYQDRTSIKIYKQDGPHVRPKKFSFQVAPGLWFVRHKKERFPTIDVNPVKEEGDKVVYAIPKARSIWPNKYYLKSEIYPRQHFPYGPMKVWGPLNPLGLFLRYFGPDWDKKARFTSHHAVGTGDNFSFELTPQNREFLKRYNLGK